MTSGPTLPRGIRNNNPGNLERNATAWQGLAAAQTDPRFCVFASPFWGLRALMRTLLTYQRRYRLQTILALIARWAPANENNTDAYARAVAVRLGVGVDAAVDLTERAVLEKFARAIVRHENGAAPPSSGRPADWYSDADFSAASKAALE